MKKIGFVVALCWLLVDGTLAGTLSPADAESLRADIVAMMAAADRGDMERLIERTHPSLQTLAGGPEAYAGLVRQAGEQIRQGGIKFISSDVGAPTQTYAAGDEEVCFVPRVSVIEAQGRRVKSTSFMIAIRRLGDKQWKYLDGAGLRSSPALLQQLLPQLEPGITLPPNVVEPL